jgi:hypothetical protein
MMEMMMRIKIQQTIFTEALENVTISFKNYDKANQNLEKLIDIKNLLSLNGTLPSIITVNQNQKSQLLTGNNT